MIIKTIAIIAFIAILISLGVALYNLVKNTDQEKSEKIVKALTLRISLSIILFIFIFIALTSGLFEPHGIGVRMQQHKSSTPELPK